MRRSARLRTATTSSCSATRRFLVQLFLIFFGLPSLGIKLGGMAGGDPCMVLNLGITAPRSSRQPADAAQAAGSGRSLAFTRWQIFLRHAAPGIAQGLAGAVQPGRHHACSVRSVCFADLDRE